MLELVAVDVATLAPRIVVTEAQRTWQDNRPTMRFAVESLFVKGMPPAFGKIGPGYVSRRERSNPGPRGAPAGAAEVTIYFQMASRND